MRFKTKILTVCLLMTRLSHAAEVNLSSLDQITAPKVQELINEFVQKTTPNRVPGELGSKKARTFLKDFFKKREVKDKSELIVQNFLPPIDAAQKMYLDDFENQIAKKYPATDPLHIHWKKFTEHTLGLLAQFKEVPGENIIFFIKAAKAQARETIYLLANYDTILKDEEGRPKIGGNMPGADDNASGVVTALMAADYFSKNPLNANLVIILFDYQELAFMGARSFLGSRQELKIPAPSFFISALMLGHDSSFFDKNKQTGNMKVYLRQKNKEDAELWQQFKNEIKENLFKPLDNSFDMGDHTVLWQANIPGLVFSQDWENDLNSKQHTPNDLPEALNFDTLSKSIRAILSGLQAWK